MDDGLTIPSTISVERLDLRMPSARVKLDCEFSVWESDVEPLRRRPGDGVLNLDISDAVFDQQALESGFHYRRRYRCCNHPT
jgi:hypothetical protein